MPKTSISWLCFLIVKQISKLRNNPVLFIHFSFFCPSIYIWEIFVLLNLFVGHFILSETLLLLQLHWEILNVITDNIITLLIWLNWPGFARLKLLFLCNLGWSSMAYCYHSVFSLSRSQSDHIKQIPLYSSSLLKNCT